MNVPESAPGAIGAGRAEARAVTALTPTLAAACYLDDAVWQTERQRIFGRQWLVAGRAEDLPAPGDHLRVDIAGESVVVVRRDDGSLGGFFNVCRHRGAELVAQCDAERGHFGSAVRCPYHAWTYGLDGTLRRAPFLPAERLDADAPIALHPIGVATWGGFLFVHLDPATARPLADQLGGVPDRLVRYPLDELRRGVAFTYAVAANWKVLAENYNECYHCGPVHPELCELVPAFRRGGVGLAWTDGVPHRPGAWTFTTTGTSSRAPFPELSTSERARHKGELVYPNLLLSLSAEHAAAFALRPVDAGHTEVRCDLLFHPDALADPAFDPSDAADLWDLVNGQDWAICESVQRGMASRAWRGGWFAPMEDESADITRWYTRAMAPG
ncbi:MAG: aromatic ring-hydroxylating dioxygenase subunit alpha [Acidimicrobiia bacterium]|nr:aromatic ring-hydroxylating dioxygenase subunit alpha [Acidimicrobiia bacterium]